MNASAGPPDAMRPETGRRLADSFERLDDELVELFLILNGYSPEDTALDGACRAASPTI